MGLGIYVDGKYAASLGSINVWGAAASYIEKHTPHRTPLRRLAEEGETYQPEQAASMLADLLNLQKPSPDIAETLRTLHPLLKGRHVVISDNNT
jgi:hypothetical protein